MLSCSSQVRFGENVPHLSCCLTKLVLTMFFSDEPPLVWTLVVMVEGGATKGLS